MNTNLKIKLTLRGCDQDLESSANLGFYDSMIYKYGPIEELVREHSKKKAKCISMIIERLKEERNISSKLIMEYNLVRDIERKIESIAFVGYKAFENFGDVLGEYLAFQHIFENPDVFPDREQWLSKYGKDLPLPFEKDHLGPSLKILDRPYFTLISYKDKKYELSSKQKILVQLLFENAEKGTERMSTQSLRTHWTDQTTSNFRVDKIFAQTKNKELHGTLLKWEVKGRSKMYFLDL